MSEPEKTSVRLRVDDVRSIPDIVESYLKGINSPDLVLLQLDSEKFPRRTMDFPENVRKYVMTHSRVKIEWDVRNHFVQDSNWKTKLLCEYGKLIVTLTSWPKRI